MALANSRNHLLNNENLILFKACQQGDLKTLEEYLNILSPSDISSIRDEQKATLAHYAARYGHIHILEYLIDKKNIDISQLRTEHGATCAHDAAVCDQVQTINYIFHYQQLNKHNKQYFFDKLRWTIRDQEGNSPLHLAAAYGSIRTLHYLLEHESADPHIRAYNGFQPIHYAASSGHGNCVKLLLNVAPDTVNEQTSTLFTPIYLACQHGSLDTIKILSSQGANVKLRDEHGLNCLHAACQSPHLQVVQWLIETQDINIDDVDYLNNTPLHYAAASGSQAILTYLLGKKARIIISTHGNTPLHVAAENGHRDACTILIERGHCSVTLKNNSQLTPIDLASQNGFSSLANELRLHANPSSFSEKTSENSKKIQLENATIVRLVVKKRNVERSDASNQVNEDELMTNSDITNDSITSRQLTNQRFDLSELLARVGDHEASRQGAMYNGDTNVLMHSMDSLNQQNRSRQRVKLPSQTYAPWLKMGNMKPGEFQKEIEKVGANLRKVGRDDLLTKDNEKQNSFKRQSQSLGPRVISSTSNDETSSISNTDYSNNHTTWKRQDLKTNSTIPPISKSHQFITSPSQSTSQSDRPAWQRDLINRRRAAANGITS